MKIYTKIAPFSVYFNANFSVLLNKYIVHPLVK